MVGLNWKANLQKTREEESKKPDLGIPAANAASLVEYTGAQVSKCQVRFLGAIFCCWMEFSIYAEFSSLKSELCGAFNLICFFMQMQMDIEGIMDTGEIHALDRGPGKFSNSCSGRTSFRLPSPTEAAHSPLLFQGKGLARSG